MRTCIIGAGASGIATAKVFAERGLDFDWFEMGSDIGGNWRYNNDNGRSAAYDSLHIDTSKERMAYSDFPMPPDYPAYPHHSQVFDYFNAYVDHFQLRDRVTFNTEVTSVEPAAEGRWNVAVRRDGTESTAEYGAVIVANGHHWNPRVPDFPGIFAGESIHSRGYRSPDDLRGKRLLVLGSAIRGRTSRVIWSEWRRKCSWRRVAEHTSSRGTCSVARWTRSRPRVVRRFHSP